MELSEKGLNFIKSFEGCILHPYDDGFGNISIGWGMTYYPDTGIAVKMTDNVITQAQADAYFLLMVKPYATGTTEALGGTVINQNQFNVLVDFAYNCGIGSFRESTLCEHVKTNTVVESDFTEYDHIGITVNADLLVRRQAEYNLFMTVDMTITSVPVSPITNKSSITTKMNSTTTETLRVLSNTVSTDGAHTNIAYVLDAVTRNEDGSTTIAQKQTQTWIAPGVLNAAESLTYAQAQVAEDINVVCYYSDN